MSINVETMVQHYVEDISKKDHFQLYLAESNAQTRRDWMPGRAESLGD